MKTKTEQVLQVMQVLAWVAFIGFLIEAGSILVSFFVSIINPDASKNLYDGANFLTLRKLNIGYFTLRVSFVIVLSLMKSYVWLLVIKTLSKIALLNPFKMDVAVRLEKISYVLFGTWVVGMVSSGYTAWLVKQTGEVFGGYVSGEFIFMAGLVFIISQIFKRGVEIQSENDLTV